MVYPHKMSRKLCLDHHVSCSLHRIRLMQRLEQQKPAAVVALVPAGRSVETTSYSRWACNPHEYNDIVLRAESLTKIFGNCKFAYMEVSKVMGVTPSHHPFE